MHFPKATRVVPEFDSKQLKPPRNLAQLLKMGVAGDKM